MLSDPDFLKFIVFALFGIVVVETIAIVYLALKRNTYYVDEDGEEIKENVAPILTPQASSMKTMVVKSEEVRPTIQPKKEVPVEVKGTLVKKVIIKLSVNGAEDEIEIDHFPCLMGREIFNCDVVINEPAVSRRHAQLILENGQVYLEDVSEHNGTFLNGTKLESLGRERVHEGDVINLGRAEIQVLKFEY